MVCGTFAGACIDHLMTLKTSVLTFQDKSEVDSEIRMPCFRIPWVYFFDKCEIERKGRQPSGSENSYYNLNNMCDNTNNKNNNNGCYPIVSLFPLNVD